MTKVKRTAPRKTASKSRAKTPKKPLLVNNVIFVIDQSPSMGQHARSANEVIKSLVGPLSQSGFKTRVSTYTFNESISRGLYLSENLRDLKNFSIYPSGTGTALIRATIRAIQDHKNDFLVTNNKTEDNTYLLYVITDGQENQRGNPLDLRDLITSLDDSWTVATMVPNQHDAHYAKNCGFPAGNIAVWDVNSDKGFEEVGRTMTSSYQDYTTARSSGLRSMNNLFTVNAANVTKADVKDVLVQDKDAHLLRCYNAEPIRDFVESHGYTYKIGNAFYELTKREKVQPQKEVAIVSKDGKRKYFGDAARQMLGLQAPDIIKVAPGDHGDWRIFIQSTSVNRKVVPGQSILLRN